MSKTRRNIRNWDRDGNTSQRVKSYLKKMNRTSFKRGSRLNNNDDDYHTDNINHLNYESYYDND